MTDIQAIRGRESKATKGPWREYKGWVHPSFDWPSPHSTNGDTAICEPLGPDAPANAQFIAHARADIPDLLSSHKSLVDEIERLRRLLKGWLDYDNRQTVPLGTHDQLVVDTVLALNTGKDAADHLEGKS